MHFAVLLAALLITFYALPLELLLNPSQPSSFFRLKRSSGAGGSGGDVSGADGRPSSKLGLGRQLPGSLTTREYVALVGKDEEED